MIPYPREHTGDDYIPAISASADLIVVRARRGDAAASQAAGWRGEALLASWPFGSFGPSQKNKEYEIDSTSTQVDIKNL